METWTYFDKPTLPGWYAVLICYDESEGAFPDAARWENNEWNRRAVIAWNGPFNDNDEAMSFAKKNDPDFPGLQEKKP